MAMLRGRRVLEISETRAAAFSGKLLRDVGAEVVALRPAETPRLSRAARVYMDQGKDVLSLPETREQSSSLSQIVAHCDAVVTDLSPAGLAARSLDWDSVHALAPSVVYVRLGAVPDDVALPESDAAELTMQATSGYMYLTGFPDREPLGVPYGLGSVQLGLHGAGALAGGLYDVLYGEHETGCLVEIAGSEVLASIVRIYASVFMYYGIPMQRDGRRAPGSGGRYPFGLFRCQDGYVAVIVRNDEQWQRFLGMLGHPDWANQPRYQDFHGMAIDYPGEVDSLWAGWLLERTRAELMELAREQSLPIGPVRSVSEIFEDEQLLARGFFRTTDVDGVPLRIPGPPWSAAS